MMDTEESREQVKTGRKADPKLLLFLLCWGIALIWRLYVMIRYSYQYVDDDQAIMWYGTVHFAHGHFPEPCFFGQDYNSMLESLLSVPLYLLGWPLYVAMPTVSTLLCVIPFAYCSYPVWKKGKKNAAFFVVILFAAAAWKWDVLTSIPRSFIPGFPWAVMGGLMINDPDAKSGKVFAGSCLAMLGVGITASAAAVLAVAVLAMILEGKKYIRRFLPFGLGLIPGLLYIAYQKYYYTLHDADIVTHHSFEWLNLNAFLLSLKRLPELLSGTISLGVIMIPLGLLAVIVFCVRKKNVKFLILMGASLAGVLLTLSLGWMVVSNEGSLLFGQLRLMLYWMPLILLLTGLFFLQGTEEKAIRIFPQLSLALVLLCVAGKALVFTGEIKDAESPLYKDSRVTVLSVEGLKRQAGQIVELAKLTESDVLVCVNYASVIAYGSSALYYDEAIDFYVPDRDRRVWLYHKLQDAKGQRLMLYSLPVAEDMQLAVEDMGERSVPEFFERTYGISRGGELDWGIRGPVE